MKKKVFIFAVVSLAFLPGVFSQALTVNAQLNFGVAYENAPDSLPLTITNTLNRVVNVNGIKFYDTYGVPAFSASEDHFSINPLSAYHIWIRFSPRHNIFHNSEMVIVNDGLRGYTEMDLVGQGRYSNTYYDSTENLSEESLKSALHDITGVGYVALGYNIARDSMFMSIDNKKINGQGAAQNTIECVYTGREAVGYTDRTDCQTNFSFNTEHTFPQSFFSSLEPMKSDLHHLFGCDDLANNYRSDNPYGVITGGTIWAVGGSKATNSLFEPRDEQKGIASRALMYFVLRYQNYGGFFTSQESILRTWHDVFPPDATEKKRNDDIDAVQHNRNPFVDYPQFIERIHSIAAASTAPVVKSIDPAQDTIIYGFVQQGTPEVFHYVIVNNGNSDVQLSDFSLSQPELTFQSGGNDTVLAAGEALALDIRLVAADADSIHAFLNFNSDDAAHASVSIPVFANDSILNHVGDFDSDEFGIYPNPVRDELRIQNSDFKIKGVRINDAFGKEIMIERQAGNSSLIIPVSGLARGIYFVVIETETNIFFRKILKY